MDNLKNLKEKAEILKKASSILKVEDKDLQRVLKRFQNEIEEMDRKIK